MGSLPYNYDIELFKNSYHISVIRLALKELLKKAPFSFNLSYSILNDSFAPPDTINSPSSSFSSGCHFNVIFLEIYVIISENITVILELPNLYYITKKSVLSRAAEISCKKTKAQTEAVRFGLQARRMARRMQ